MPALTVAIIGAGISGLAQAITLQNLLGEQVDIQVYEKSHSPGGVWRDAKWAGASVDVPIQLYSLWSDPVQWKSFYASQPEVLAYWLSLIDKHKLADRIHTDTEVVRAVWNDQAAEYEVTLRRSGRRRGTGADKEEEDKEEAKEQEWTVKANVLISANGPLSKPVIPKFKGLDQFQGQYFHNLHWDETVALEGKRIALVGNGSSGVQIAPGLAALKGAHLTHVIRSGGYFYPKVNYDYSRLVNALFYYIPFAQKLHRYLLFKENNDRWRAKAASKTPTKDEIWLLQYLRETAPTKALTPDYPLGCKRLAFDAGWLESLHRPNVELVKSSTLEFTPSGLITSDGKTRVVDIVIFATGADVANHGCGFRNVVGESGRTLEDAWSGGPRAYAGTATPGFPNYFHILGPNAIAGSWGFTLGVKSSFNAKLLQNMIKHGITSIQPRQDAFDKHNARVQEALQKTNMASELCTNWWRADKTGIISVPNSVSGEQCRHIRWKDWIAKRRGEVIDVGELEAGGKRRRVVASGLLAGLVGGVLLVYRLDRL